MKNKIAGQLMLAFLASLLTFSLVLGGVFIALYRDNAMKTKKAELIKRAEAVAATFSSITGEYGNGKGKGRQGGQNGGGEQGYGAFVRYLSEISGFSVWLVDENLQLVTGKMGGKQYIYEDLPSGAEKVVQEVFKGGTTFSEDFSPLLESPTLTVGTPVKSGNTITGVLLVHSPVGGVTEVTKQGVKIMLMSLVAALFLSILLAAALSLKFTRPLNKMKMTAVSLASGDYSVKTGIEKEDEMGELAKAIDIMSEKLAEAKLESEKLENMRREFVANISHELKTPVTVLRGSLEALCDGVVTEPEKVTSYHSRMLSETLYLQRLITDLLDLSRLQNTDFKIEEADINLPEVLSDAVRSASLLADKKGLEVTETLEDKTFRVRGDYGRLRQMFLIVLDNAIKFSPQGGRVEVSLKGGSVIISDSGPGIPEKDLPYIFDRFYKTASEDNKSGSGLGLAIAKQIAERHKASVTAENRENGGALFRFNFKTSL